MGHSHSMDQQLQSGDKKHLLPSHGQVLQRLGRHLQTIEHNKVQHLSKKLAWEYLALHQVVGQKRRCTRSRQVRVLGAAEVQC